jgi:hypothetical protein
LLSQTETGPGRNELPEPQTLIENFSADVDGPGAPHSITLAEVALEKAGHLRKTDRVIGLLPVGKYWHDVAVDSEVDKYEPDESVIEELEAPN